MMQKDEEYLLGPWLAFHGHLFGFDNLFVLDNGSSSSKVIELLSSYEQHGVRVIREFPTREDYNRKGDIIGAIIRHLDGSGDYDFLLPFDCDEFLCLRTPWGFTLRK